MRTRLLIALAVSAMSCCILAGSAAAANSAPGAPYSVTLPLTGVSPAELQNQAAVGATVPVWTASIKSPTDGKTYSYSMVGKSPLTKQTTPTTSVPADVIPVSFTFADSGHTFNPAAKDPTCLPSSTATANSLLLGSPIYKTHAYTVGGTSIGTVQYVDGFQREEYAKYVLASGAINPGYNVDLTPVTNHALVKINVSTANGVTDKIGCGGFTGLLSISWWDNYVQKTLLPSLKASITPTHFPLFEFYNVVMYQGSTSNCCIIGYHSAYASPSFSGAVQTYAVGDYDSSQLFSNLSDVGAISHEVGEWMNDPYGNNATPAWGHVGQVSGCQANLEVGDPLSGTTPISVKMTNGITYHAQELAFRDWFYRTPSVGLKGWFSSNGHFTKSAGALCS